MLDMAAGQHLHSLCTVNECSHQDAGWTDVPLPTGDVRFDGCPRKHLKDVRHSVWFGSYRWFVKGKMPADFGVPVDRLDPRYPDAMELIEWAVDFYKPPPPL